jgi:AraC family transcriptional regulator, transcriptional activator of pobA
MKKSTFPVYDIATLSDFKQEDIQISRFAPYLDIHPNLHLPHKHNFYHLVLFTEGGGSHAIDFTSFKVKPFQVYFMIPGQVHGWSFEGRVDGYVINFSGQFFQSLLLNPDYLEQFAFFDGVAENSVIDLPKELQGNVRNLFEQMIAESEKPVPFSADMIRSLLLQFFIMVSRLGAQQGRSSVSIYNYTLFKNFQRLVEKNFAEMKLPRDYAALLYITPNHLNALCNEVINLSAGEVIRNRIILEAKRLLTNFDLSISEIAYRLNFQDNSYFTKFFKKQEGIGPEEFRKNFNTKDHENKHKLR